MPLIMQFINKKLYIYTFFIYRKHNIKTVNLNEKSSNQEKIRIHYVVQKKNGQHD